MGHTKKPDVFESMPDTVGITHEDDCHLHKAVVSLLRRQHRAYVRMVKARWDGMAVDDAWDKGYTTACNDILAALTRYAKGKGTP